MTARYMADRVRHRQYRQAESKGNPEEPDPQAREACRQDRTAAASENKPKRAEKFGDHPPRHIAFHRVFPSRPFRPVYRRLVAATPPFSALLGLRQRIILKRGC